MASRERQRLIRLAADEDATVTAGAEIAQRTVADFIRWAALEKARELIGREGKT